jgi:flagellar biosynthesis protein FlhF
MKIKRFEAASMAEALRMVKKEFGEEAVILSAKTASKAGRLFGARQAGQVVVTAAIDPLAVKHVQNAPVEGTGALTYPSGTPEKDVESNAGLGNILRRYTPISRTGQQKLQPKFVSLMSASQGAQAYAQAQRPDRSIREQLQAQGVEHALASELAEGVDTLLASDCTADEPRAQEDPTAALARIIEARGWVAPVSAAHNRSARIVVLVGPAGAGKTATAAKILGHAIMQGDLTAGILSLDDQRIGATLELQRFSHLLGLRLETARTMDQVTAALDRMGDAQLVLVDTPGLGPDAFEGRQALMEMIKCMHDPEVHLVLNATMREKALAKVISFFRPLGITRVLPTHLDWCDQFGPVLNQLEQCRLPISYRGTGSQVPEGLHGASAREIAALLLSNSPAELDAQAGGAPLSAAPRSRASAAGAGRYVANRNSDIFHDRGCKSVKRSNDGNALVFKDAAEAMEQGFKPCRMCSMSLLAPKPLDRPARHHFAGSRN